MRFVPSLVAMWASLAMGAPGPESRVLVENRYLRVLGDPARPGDGLRLVNRLASGTLDLSTAAPEFEFDGFVVGGPRLQPRSLYAETTDRETRITFEYPPRAVNGLQFQPRTVFSVPRDSSLLRKCAELYVTTPAPAEGITAASASAPDEADDPLTLRTVLLVDEPAGGPVTFTMDGWQSYPVFTDQFFWGIEFPVARAVLAGQRVRLSHSPGKVLRPPFMFRTRDAVIGACPSNRVREAFEEYVSSFRPATGTLHFNYNSWWTSPVPFTEKDILGLIREFDEQLYRGFGASFDTFTIDLGWSETQGIWRIGRKLFPRGFTPLDEALAAQHARLGLWWSPSNCYSPLSFDNDWAAAQGYETMLSPRPSLPPLRHACLAAGTRYQRETSRALCAIARDFDLGQMKFDGYIPSCPEAGHGHLPGELSREATAEGIIRIFSDLRQTRPDLWLETTCFGFDASPWWLRHVNSVIGPFGDDAPYGAVPAPVYRESYTTSRDFYNLHGSVTPVPIAAQEVLGIIHQTAEPMFNDAVTTLLRGHEFISLYLNPRHMNQRDYAFLAALMKWSRANAGLLGRTRVIWPADWRVSGPAPFGELKSMPRQPYGYAHWRNGQGLVCLRNPWIAPARFPLRLDEATLGLDATAGKVLAAVQVYPYPACLAGRLAPGGELPIELGPYETRVVRLLEDDPRLEPAPDLRADALRGVRLQPAGSALVEVTSRSPETQPLGDDYTVCSRPTTLVWESQLEGTTPEQGWSIYWLVESLPPAKHVGEAEVQIDGRPAAVRMIDSEAGWSAAQAPGKQNTWRWYVASLPAGTWRAEARIELPDRGAIVSAWAMRQVAPPPSPSPVVLEAAGTPAMPLPPGYCPEVSTQVVAMQKLSGTALVRRVTDAKIERIHGIYLDRLQPVSVSQGWGELKRNQSVAGNPLCIGTRRFLRGLGTHAVSRIVYDLRGRFRVFRGWAGQDAGANGTINMEIHVDGRKVWESGRLTRADAPREFSVPLEGARELTLVATDGGDNFMADHVDWADAWLESADRSASRPAVAGGG